MLTLLVLRVRNFPSSSKIVIEKRKSEEAPFIFLMAETLGVSPGLSSLIALKQPEYEFLIFFLALGDVLASILAF